jgi:hypothetical protein
MGFKVIAAYVYFVSADLNGPLIITVPVFGQGIGPRLGKNRQKLEKQKEDKSPPQESGHPA